MNKKYSTRFLYSYVFITGASVMALELAASRFLAPYYGTSMIVWANIIGLILLSLAVGYVVGGRWADRRPDGRLLMGISLAAGVWTSTLPMWGHFIFRAISAGILDTPIVTIVLSFLAILLVFAPPVFLLAMVSPFAIRLVAGDPQQIGKVAGNLYSFSTLGSLVGTFGTAFGTIPFLGTNETMFLWSAALILISLWGFSKASNRTIAKQRAGRFLGLFLLVPILLNLWLSGPTKAAANVLYSKDTLYQFVQVLRGADGSTELVYNEGGGVQSLHRPNDALSASDYYDDYLLLPYLVPNTKQVLVLGSAGGTIPHLLATYDKPQFPQMQITGVEIDPAVIPLDQKYFGLQPQDATLVNQDARVYLNSTAKKYDIIVVDAYSQQIYIPFHLSTQEFFQQVRSKLQPDGVVALNVNATTADSQLLLAMEKTVRSVFPHTYVIKARGAYNYVLIGATQAVDENRLQQVDAQGPLAPIVSEWPHPLQPLPAQAVANATLLTDDRAPTEMMTDSMIFGAAKQEVR